MKKNENEKTQGSATAAAWIATEQGHLSIGTV